MRILLLLGQLSMILMKKIDIRTIPKGTKRLVSRRGNAFDVGRLMQSIVDQSVNNATIKEFVRKHPMDEKQIFDYAYSKALFRPDTKNKQVVKTPLSTIRTKKANCVCYSILMATLLKLNKIPGKFRLVTFKEDTYPKHVFIVTDSGKILDCVLGQKQKGETSFEERENKAGKFNEESKYYAKFDMPY